MMRISFEKPPIWEEVAKAFKFEPGTVFTYGDTIYCPDRVAIPDHLMVHEEVHAQQQGYDVHLAAIWWKRYITDVKFRVEQEVEAYIAQYKFICSKIKDKNARFKNLHALAAMLCGPMYGNALSYTDAMRRIREGK